MKIFLDIENRNLKSLLLRVFNEFIEDCQIEEKIEKAQVIFTDKMKNYTLINKSNFIFSSSEYSVGNQIVVNILDNFEECTKANFPFLYIEPTNMFKNIVNIKGLLQFLKRFFHVELEKLNQKLWNIESQLFMISKVGWDTLEEVIVRISSAVESRDYFSPDHVKRVANYCRIIADYLGFSSEFIKKIYLASFLHDIGKIAIPDSILLKAGRLTDEEFEIVKKHTLIGSQILANSNNEVIKMAEVIAISHHEKYDGSGYPFGLKGEDIPIEGRIVALADVFDSITSRRPYREPKTVEEAIYEIRKGINTHFCPEVVNAFFKSIKKIIEVRYGLTLQFLGNCIITSTFI